jgi:hypothetical protein
VCCLLVVDHLAVVRDLGVQRVETFLDLALPGQDPFAVRQQQLHPLLVGIAATGEESGEVRISVVGMPVARNRTSSSIRRIDSSS